MMRSALTSVPTPEGWVERPLGEIVDFLNSRCRQIKGTGRAKMKGDIPYYGASGIVDYVNDYNFDEDLILLGKIGENIISRVKPLAFKISGKAWVSSNTHAFNPRDFVSIDYLAEYLESLSYERFNSGSAQPYLSPKSCQSIPAVFPANKIEQELIAKALNNVNILIYELEEVLAKKRLIKRGILQQLLSGEKRLPGFSGKWDEKTFGEIFDFYPTATNSRSELTEDGDAFYIHYGDIHTKFCGHLDFQKTSIPRIGKNQCKNAALLKNGDWIIADVSEDFDGIGMSVEVSGLEDGQQAISGLHTFLLREKKSMYAPGFKGYLSYSLNLRKQYMRVMTGMKVFGVTKTALRNLVLPVPGINEQNAIVSILSDMGDEILALEEKLSKTRKIKQAMAQDLLTGKIRLV